MKNNENIKDYTRKCCQKIHLRKIPDSRKTYIGTISEFGMGYIGENKDIEDPAISLINIKDEKGNIIPQQWFNRGKNFNKLNLKIGDKLRFTACTMEFNIVSDDDETPKGKKYKLGYVKDVKKLRSVVKRIGNESEE